jgi:hypothetical protein
VSSKVIASLGQGTMGYSFVDPIGDLIIPEHGDDEHHLALRLGIKDGVGFVCRGSVGFNHLMATLASTTRLGTGV